MTLSIIKNNQQAENFSRIKLAKSIQLALNQSGELITPLDSLIDTIESYLNIFSISANNILTTEILHALTLKALNENNLPKTANIYNNFKKNKNQTDNDNLQKQQIISINEFYFDEPIQDLNKFKKAIQQISKTYNFPFQDFFQNRQLIFSPALFHKNNYDKSQIILEDNLNSIFDNLKQLAVNHQSGISTLLDFSQLRPRNSLIGSTKGKSAGPISFMKIFLSSLEALDQNKSLSHQPLPHQITLSIDHPDILDYLILIKNQPIGISNHFNFQIKINQQFLETLFKCNDFELINPINQEIVNFLSSSNLFDLLISTAQENPRLELIRDTQIQNSQNFTHLHLNLSAFFDDNKFSSDNLLSLLERLTSLQDQFINTKLKININGLGELFNKMQLAYFSIQTLEFCEKLIDIFNIFKDKLSFTAIENSLVQSILNTTIGIEPYSELVKIKDQIDGSDKIEILPKLEKILINHQLLQDTLLRQIATLNSIQFVTDLPENERHLFQTNQDLNPKYQLQIKQLFEEKLKDNFTKSINFPRNSNHQEIKELLIFNLKNNLQSLSLLQFEENEDKHLEQSFSEQKKILLNLHKKKRKSKQIQPPLFQIKKTEEIILPPINPSIHES